MAMTATISVSPATALINEQINCNLTVSNSGGSAVNVLSVVPTTLFTGASQPMPSAAGVGVVPLSPGFSVSVPASGSLVIPFGVVFFAPSTGPLGAGTGTYSIGAVVTSSDGSIFSPTAATAIVNPIALPSAEQ